MQKPESSYLLFIERNADSKLSCLGLLCCFEQRTNRIEQGLQLSYKGPMLSETAAKAWSETQMQTFLEIYPCKTYVSSEDLNREWPKLQKLKRIDLLKLAKNKLNREFSNLKHLILSLDNIFGPIIWRSHLAIKTENHLEQNYLAKAAYEFLNREADYPLPEIIFEQISKHYTLRRSRINKFRIKITLKHFRPENQYKIKHQDQILMPETKQAFSNKNQDRLELYLEIQPEEGKQILEVWAENCRGSSEKTFEFEASWEIIKEISSPIQKNGERTTNPKPTKTEYENHQKPDHPKQRTSGGNYRGESNKGFFENLFDFFATLFAELVSLLGKALAGLFAFYIGVLILFWVVQNIISPIFNKIILPIWLNIFWPILLFLYEKLFQWFW